MTSPSARQVLSQLSSGRCDAEPLRVIGLFAQSWHSRQQRAVLRRHSCRRPNTTDRRRRFDSVPAPTTTRRTIPTDRLVVGWTHTQYSIDPDNSAAANDAAIDILRDLAPVQNQHIMGFGALNPEPSKGVYDWASLDYRMDAIRRSGAIPVITLCCAPDWMKGGKSGSTDWSRIEAAPLPAFFDDFANLSAEVAKRYPDVDYFLVWNELKGFFDNAQNRWQYELYVELYNKVYAAVKKVRPTAKIGGPYVVVDTVADARPVIASVVARRRVGSIRSAAARRHRLLPRACDECRTSSFSTGDFDRRTPR